MAPMTYRCDSCSQQILSTNPRAHCLVCDDYDLCANCTLGERFSGTHTLEHGVSVFKQSGGGDERPLLAERASLTFDQGYAASSSAISSSPTSASRPTLNPPPLPRRRSAIITPPSDLPTTTSSTKASKWFIPKLVATLTAAKQQFRCEC
ncbi:hypothetical protein AAF712_002769 [Marasmius tenuissimus]|uniref:ZZ-type domain-containing protein n=1 Tax=Marasmius tenuissimus TaxID=585030 RepID=A0ABR3A8H8_9AGAR